MKRLWALWKMRNTSFADLAELHQIIILAARRCAYDLLHAAQDAKHESKMWHQNALFWLSIFNPTDSGKHYRNKFHHEIDYLESEIARLSKLCTDHGINPGDPNRIPF